MDQSARLRGDDAFSLLSAKAQRLYESVETYMKFSMLKGAREIPPLDNALTAIEDVIKDIGIAPVLEILDTFSFKGETKGVIYTLITIVKKMLDSEDVFMFAKLVSTFAMRQQHSDIVNNLVYYWIKKQCESNDPLETLEAMLMAMLLQGEALGSKGKNMYFKVQRANMTKEFIYNDKSGNTVIKAENPNKWGILLTRERLRPGSRAYNWYCTITVDKNDLLLREEKTGFLASEWASLLRHKQHLPKCPLWIQDKEYRCDFWYSFWNSEASVTDMVKQKVLF